MSLPAEVLSRPPEVSFRGKDVTPPSPLYVAREDNLRFEVSNSVTNQTLEVRGRLLLASGEVVPFAETLRPAATRTVQSFFVQLTEGFLLSLMVAHGPETLPGQTWVRCTLFHGETSVGTFQALLFQGYVSTGYWLAWPPGIYDRIADGPGAIRSVTGTNPAAGAEISETVPTNALWRLYSVRAALVTNATVAARRVSLVIDDGTTILIDVENPNTQAAGLTVPYLAARFGYDLTTTTVAEQFALPDLPPLREGFRVRTVTSNLQAGDNWGAPQLLLEEWIEF